MPRILSLDLAHATGWCEGQINGVPITGTIVLGGPNAAIEKRCSKLAEWLDAYLTTYRPNVLSIEASVVAQMRGKFMATEAVMKSVYGLLMRAREVAIEDHGYRSAKPVPGGVYLDKSLVEINPQEVRKHFVGQPRFAVTDDGKRAVALKAREIGWTVNSLDAADAAALWDATCCYVAPSVYMRGHSAKFTGRVSSDFRPSIGKRDPRLKSDGPLFSGA
jgi:hypothetical protein